MTEQVTTGAANDLEKAGRIANAIVKRFGMSEKIGWIGLESSEGGSYCSDETQREADLEARMLIEQCTEKTREVLRTYKEQTQK